MGAAQREQLTEEWVEPGRQAIFVCADKAQAEAVVRIPVRVAQVGLVAHRAAEQAAEQVETRSEERVE